MSWIFGENSHNPPCVRGTGSSPGSLLHGGESRTIPGLFTGLAAVLAGNEVITEAVMKADTHPNYTAVKVTCSCGETFETRSTSGSELAIEVCSRCHPFYTGKQKMVDTGGRVDKFRQRYGNS